MSESGPKPVEAGTSADVLKEEEEEDRADAPADVALVPSAVDAVPDDDAENNDDGDDDDGDDDSEDSGKESIESDESSFHPSDYENDSGFDPAKSTAEMLVLAAAFKEKGNEHYANQDLVRSARSYKMGISVLKPVIVGEAASDNNDDDDDIEQAKSTMMALSNNLSMISLNKNKPKLAIDVAKKALDVDPNNCKAYYRRAMGYKKLGDNKAAKKDLREAVRCDGTNKTALKELHALHKYMTDIAEREKKAAKAAFSFDKKKGGVLYEDKYEAERLKQEEEDRKELEKIELEKQRKQDWEDECVKLMAAGKEAVSFEDWNKKRKKIAKEARKLKKQEDRKIAKEKKEEEERLRLAKKKAAAKAAAAEEKEEEEEDGKDALTDKDFAQFRGYKSTPDGRTTSYFSREQSEHEKDLIGDITPKRLDANGDPVGSGPVRLSPKTNNEAVSTGKGKASAWNAGGSTWEEKDATDWCTKQLQVRLKESIAKVVPLVGVVTLVDNLKGESSVAVAGGRKRYIFDFHCKLDFEIRDDDVDEIVASGSLILPDINSGNHDDFEVDVSQWKKEPSSDFAEKASSCRKDLTKAVRNRVLDFVNDFNGHY